MIQKNFPIVWQERYQAMGFETCSEIQKQVFKPLLEKETLMGISPTGTGKTLAYLWPTLLNTTPGKGNQLLILTSSQELGMQVFEVAREWGKDLDLNVLSLIGGANVKRQVEKLKEKPEVLVGTPGRVLELIKLKKVKAHLLQTVILDEVDQLLAKGSQTLTIDLLKRIPKNSQFGFFSATAEEALPMVVSVVKDPKVIDVTKEDTSKGQIKHYYLNYSKRQVVDVLRRLVHTPDFQGLVFFNQLGDMGSAEEKLLYHQISVASLASDLTKDARKIALGMFREKKVDLLLTTDVASRGLDISQLTYVVNTEVPLTKESYLHRAGRVGRMGTTGAVITIVQDHTLNDLKKIANKLEISLEEVFLHHGAIQFEKSTKENEREKQPERRHRVADTKKSQIRKKGKKKK